MAGGAHHGVGAVTRRDSPAAEAQRNRYHARREARLCVVCAAGLQEHDTIRCIECEERKATYEESPDAADRRRARARDRAFAQYHADPEAARGLVAARRLARKIRGICTFCHRRAAEDHALCEEHRDSERARIREQARRRRAAARAKNPLREDRKEAA